jgi:hypothetical protein
MMQMLRSFMCSEHGVFLLLFLFCAALFISLLILGVINPSLSIGDFLFGMLVFMFTEVLQGLMKFGMRQSKRIGGGRARGVK